MFLMRARLASNPYPKAFFVLTSVYFTLMMREHLSAPTFTLAISNLTEVFCAAQAIFFADGAFPLPAHLYRFLDVLYHGHAFQTVAAGRRTNPPSEAASTRKNGPKSLPPVAPRPKIVAPVQTLLALSAARQS